MATLADLMTLEKKVQKRSLEWVYKFRFVTFLPTCFLTNQRNLKQLFGNQRIVQGSSMFLFRRVILSFCFSLKIITRPFLHKGTSVPKWLRCLLNKVRAVRGWGVVLNQRKSVRFALIKLLPPRSRTLIETRWFSAIRCGSD